MKVKILAYVQNFEPGQIVDLPDDIAKQMTQIRKRHNGYELIEYRTAMPLEEAIEIESREIPIEELTQAEADAMGIKNVVAPAVEVSAEEPAQEVTEKKGRKK